MRKSSAIVAAVFIWLMASAASAHAQRGAAPPRDTTPMPSLNVDTLPVIVMPVVFHLGASRGWKTAASLTPIIAEVQRIYDQAHIKLRPSFATDTLHTDSLDVTYEVSVALNPGTNGITYPGCSRETFIRDTVRLRHVDDARPSRIALPAYLRSGAPGPDSIDVAQQAAGQARTTAHEMGHALGLPHRQDTTNLEASGTTGWTLNAREIIVVRRYALDRFKGEAPGHKAAALDTSGTRRAGRCPRG